MVFSPVGLVTENLQCAHPYCAIISESVAPDAQPPWGAVHRADGAGNMRGITTLMLEAIIPPRTMNARCFVTHANLVVYCFRTEKCYKRKLSSHVSGSLDVLIPLMKVKLFADHL